MYVVIGSLCYSYRVHSGSGLELKNIECDKYLINFIIRYSMPIVIPIVTSRAKKGPTMRLRRRKGTKSPERLLPSEEDYHLGTP